MSAVVASAAENPLPTGDEGRFEARIDVAKAQKVLFARPSDAVAISLKSTNSISTTEPPPPFANPRRVYPPSCLGSILPETPSGPQYSVFANLAARVTATGALVQETVQITVWRVPCSSSVRPTSATLMRIQRQTVNEGNLNVVPQFPGTNVSQGSVTFDGGYPFNLLRAATESNTFATSAAAGDPIIFSTTYVLEVYPNPITFYFDFNQSFGLRFDNFFLSNNRFFVSIPAYVPTVSTYPTASLNMPINGYMSTNWYDPTASGEGITLQIYEVAGDPANLTAAFSWNAFDAGAVPFWLYGQATFPRGARSITTPMAYRAGGGFAGSGGPAGPFQIWGTATVTFGDCNHMRLNYAANPGLPASVPQGTGTKNWIRVANVNVLPCE